LEKKFNVKVDSRPSKQQARESSRTVQEEDEAEKRNFGAKKKGKEIENVSTPPYEQRAQGREGKEKGEDRRIHLFRFGLIIPFS
jgi:hypothetical protein